MIVHRKFLWALFIIWNENCWILTGKYWFNTFFWRLCIVYVYQGIFPMLELSHFCPWRQILAQIKSFHCDKDENSHKNKSKFSPYRLVPHTLLNLQNHTKLCFNKTPTDWGMESKSVKFCLVEAVLRNMISYLFFLFPFSSDQHLAFW